MSGFGLSVTPRAQLKTDLTRGFSGFDHPGSGAAVSAASIAATGEVGGITAMIVDSDASLDSQRRSAVRTRP